MRAPVKLCTNSLKVGDRVDATLSDAVQGSGGATLPAGATTVLLVTQSQFGNNDANKVKLAFRAVSVAFDGRTYPLDSADVTTPALTKVRRQSTGAQAGKVAAGAAIGALLGRVLGKNTRNTVAGAAAGAAGGAVVAAGTADYDGCVPANERLAVSLVKPVRIPRGG